MADDDDNDFAAGVASGLGDGIAYALIGIFRWLWRIDPIFAFMFFSALVTSGLYWWLHRG